MGVFDGDCSLGEGVIVCLPAPPPPQRIACPSPKMRATITGWGPGHATLAACVPAPLARNWTKPQQDNFMGRPLEFFPTHVCDSTNLLA